ncbi:MAG: methyltransferase domain-containing protein [Gemmatimonadota bacterium]
MPDSTIPQNQSTWQGEAYQAWVERFGPPSQAAADLARDPRARLVPLIDHLGEVAGRRVANLMGSSGIKAVALALLGARVTVIDYGEGNARYARELAAAAGVELRYLVADVLQLPAGEPLGTFDLVFAELGIVHYFTDLRPFAEAVYGLLAPGGRFALRDFHPVSTKLLSFRGSTAKVRKYKVSGDYFDTALEEREPPYAKFLPPDRARQAGKVLWRKWTLGEVVTAVATSGLQVRSLTEEPNLSSEVFDRGIPKTFTLVADKPLPV